MTLGEAIKDTTIRCPARKCRINLLHCQVTQKKNKETFGDLAPEEMRKLTKSCPCDTKERWKPEKLQEEEVIDSDGKKINYKRMGICPVCQADENKRIYIYKGEEMCGGCMTRKKQGRELKKPEVKEVKEVKKESESNARTIEAPFNSFAEPIKLDVISDMGRVEMEISDVLELEFAPADQPLFESILELAKLHRREPEQEALWILSKVIGMYRQIPPNNKKGNILKICREEVA